MIYFHVYFKEDLTLLLFDSDNSKVFENIDRVRKALITRYIDEGCFVRMNQTKSLTI